MIDMQGRLEHTLQNERVIERILQDMPKYVTEYYYVLSVNTQSTSCIDFINKIKNYLLFLNEDLNKVTFKEIEENIGRYLKTKQVKEINGKLYPTSSSYRNGIYSALKNFCDFLCFKGYINYDPFIALKRIKEKDEVTRPDLTQEKLSDMLKMVEKGVGTPRAISRQKKWKDRDKLILLLFMNTGIRNTALSEINISDINLDTGELRIIDKGKKHHVCDVSEILEYVNKWLKCRKELLREYSCEKEEALFISDQRTRMTQRAISDIVKKYANEALGYQISPHKIRAAYCTILYDETGDIEFVRAAVGHSNVATTQRYINTRTDVKSKSAAIMASKLRLI